MFRAQSDTLAPAIFERIHFLCHYVGGFAQGALEDLGKFEYGGGYFAIAVPGRRCPRRLDNVTKPRGLIRQHVVSPTDRLQFCH